MLQVYLDLGWTHDKPHNTMRYHSGFAFQRVPYRSKFCFAFFLYDYMLTNPENISWIDQTANYIIITNQFFNRYISNIINKDTWFDNSHIRSNALRVMCEYSSISSHMGLSFSTPNNDSFFSFFLIHAIHICPSHRFPYRKRDNQAGFLSILIKNILNISLFFHGWLSSYIVINFPIHHKERYYYSSLFLITNNATFFLDQSWIIPPNKRRRSAISITPISPVPCNIILILH